MNKLFLSIKWKVLIISLFFLSIGLIGQYSISKNLSSALQLDLRTKLISNLNLLLDGSYKQLSLKSESIASLIASNQNIAQGMDTNNAEMVRTALDKVANTLEIDSGIKLLSIYNKNAVELGELGAFEKNNFNIDEVKRVLNNKIPIHGILCSNSNECIYYSIIPKMIKGDTVGAIAIGTDISDIFLEYNQVSGNVIRIVDRNSANNNQFELSSGVAVLRPTTFSLPASVTIVTHFDWADSEKAVSSFLFKFNLIGWFIQILIQISVFFFLWRRLSQVSDIAKKLPLLVTSKPSNFRDELEESGPSFFNDEVFQLTNTTREISFKLEKYLENEKRIVEETIKRTSAEHYLAEKQKIFVNVSKAFENQMESIARDLHDELGQRLVSIRFDANIISKKSSEDNPDIHKRATNIVENIRALYVSVHQIIDQIRPQELDTLGLKGSIESLVEERRVHAENCKFNLSIDRNVDKVEFSVLSVVYRLVQEALTNTAKYAQATSVNIDIDVDDDNKVVKVMVSDNGVGFEMDKPRSSHGLRGMEERVATIDGSISIDSQPGKGVRIVAVVPFGRL